VPLTVFILVVLFSVQSGGTAEPLASHRPLGRS